MRFDVKRRIKNEAGVFNARKGFIKGDDKNLFIFTHRDPKNGKLFAEDYVFYDVHGNKHYGAWFDSELITLV